MNEPGRPSNPGRKRASAVALGAIILAGALLRFYGVPARVPHPDASSLVEPAMHLAPGGAPMGPYGFHGQYVWPGTPLVGILTVVYTIQFALGYALGWFADARQFAASYLENPRTWYSIASGMSACFGVGTIWLVHRLGRRLHDEPTALCAAALVSGSFMATMESQFPRPDVPSTFFVLIGLLFCIELRRSGGLRPAVVGAILVGVATACKYTAVLALVPIGLAHIMDRGAAPAGTPWSARRGPFLSAVLLALGGLVLAAGLWLGPGRMIPWTATLSPDGNVNQETIHALGLFRRMLLAGGTACALAGAGCLLFRQAGRWLAGLLLDKRAWTIVAVVMGTFLLLDPLLYLDPKGLVHLIVFDPNFLGLSRGVILGAEGEPGIGNLLWYLGGPMIWGMGSAAALLALAGLVLTAWNPRKDDLILLAFPALYSLTLVFGRLRWDRYVVTLVPFMAILAGRSIVSIVSWLPRGRRDALRTATTGLVVAACLAGQARNAIRYDRLLLQPDTREEATAWIAASLPRGSRIAQESYTGRVRDTDFPVTRYVLLPQGGTLDDFRARGFDYLLVSDTQYERALAEADRYPASAEFYRRLFREATLVKEFRPDPDWWPPPGERFRKYHIHASPTIRVYSLRP